MSDQELIASLRAAEIDKLSEIITDQAADLAEVEAQVEIQQIALKFQEEEIAQLKKDLALWTAEDVK